MLRVCSAHEHRHGILVNMQASMTVSYLIILFVYFAFIGWVWEVFYTKFMFGRWVNAGFLQGPWVPVYGFGGILAVMAVSSFVDNPWLVFVVSATIATVLEYITHWLLEKIWGLSLWDYTEMPYDLDGRICLPASLMFGFLALLAVYVVQPFVYEQVSSIPINRLDWAAGVVIAVLIVDFATTLGLALSVRRMLRKVEGSFDELSASLDRIASDLVKRNKGLAFWWSKVTKSNQRYTIERLKRAFPNIGRRQQADSDKKR